MMFFDVQPLRIIAFHLLLVLVVDVNGDEIAATGDDQYYSDDYLTIAEARTMAYLAKPFAFISIVCSYVMIREVIADQRSNCGTPVTRTLLSMAVADILFSLASFLGIWPSPASMDDPILIGNVGNQASCTFQGFLWGFGLLASVFFNASLSVLYLAIVRYNRTNTQLLRLEPWQQGCIWLCSLAIALYPIPLKLYNSVGDMCALGCNYNDVECLDSGKEDAPLLVFTLLPWICLSISMVAMGMLLCTVRIMENKSRKYATSLTPASASAKSGRSGFMQKSVRKSGPRPNNSIATANGGGDSSAEQRRVDRKKSTTVAMQGICYALAFLMTYMLNLIAASWWMVAEGWNTMLENFAYGILMPSAGTFNFFVFARTRTKMKTPEGRFLRWILCCCRCCCSRGGLGAQQVASQKTSTLRTDATTKVSVDTDSGVVPEGSRNHPRGNDDAKSVSTDNNSPSVVDVDRASKKDPGEVDSNPIGLNATNPPRIEDSILDLAGPEESISANSINPLAMKKSDGSLEQAADDSNFQYGLLDDDHPSSIDKNSPFFLCSSKESSSSAPSPSGPIKEDSSNLSSGFDANHSDVGTRLDGTDDIR